MTTKPRRTESRMLDEVRRWRREVYEADRDKTAEERAARVRELAERFGLPTAETTRPDRR